MFWQSAKHFVRKFRQIKLILWKNHFHERLKIFQKRTLFKIWRNSFTRLHLIITDIRAKFARPTHITYFAHWINLLLMLFLLLLQKNDGNIRTICSSLRLFYFFLHICLLLFSIFDFTELVYEATKFGHEAEKSLMVSRWFKF